MGSRGPAPTPTALRILRGNPGRRPLPLNEPRAPLGPPPPPAELSTAALAEWNRLTPTLGSLLTAWDQAVLAGYCSNYAGALAANAVVEEKGATYEEPDGYGNTKLKPRPEVKIAKDCWAATRAFARELGFSPAARSAIEA